MNDLGEAEFIPGIQVQRRSTGQIFLSQCAYLKDVLACFGMANCRTKPTPMKVGLQLNVSKTEGDPAVERRYFQVIGLLLYATLGTRPDLAFAVEYLDRFASGPPDSHWATLH